MIDIKQNIEYNYEYNNLELLQYYFENKNGQEIFRRKYEYDENHRLKKESKIEQGLTEVIADYTYDEDKKVLKTETTSLGAMTYYLDDLNRLEHKDLLTANGKVITEKYSYLSSNGKTSQNIEKIIYKNNTEENETIYSYKINNITAINENGKNIASYDYDNIGRLKRENNAKFNKTYIYDYDAQGNITTKKEYAYDVNKLGSLQKTIIYGYELNSSIGSSDQIKSYNGCQLSQNYVYNPSTCQFDPEQVYDNIGNPRYWFKTENGETTRGYTLQWAKGRQLKSITDGNKIYEYEYNINGLRTKKIENGTTHEYLLDGERIIRTKSNGNNINRKIDYYYDTSGISGFKWNGKLYYYRKNLQGDITEIINDNGAIESSYIYDAWGKNKTCNPNGTENNDPMFIGNINPFRYRGYYYDSETGLFYISTRYYDPEVGRWISPDSIEYLDPDSLNGLNLYAYCGCNPVMRIDPTGTAWYEFWKWDWGKIAGWVAVGIVAVAAVAAVVVGTVFTGGLLGAVLVGAGIGAMAGISGSIALQGGIQNIGNINPWKVALTGVIGGAVGAATGAFSYGISVIGAAAGQTFGYALSQSVIGGLKVAKVFSSALMIGAGKFVGGIAGGLIGTAISDYFVNTAQGKPTTFGGILESESSSWITDFIRWILS